MEFKELGTMMKSEELAIEKGKLERSIQTSIFDAITAFNKLTGITPNSIDISMMDVTNMESEIREYIVGGVKVSLSSDYLGQYTTAELKKQRIELKNLIKDKSDRSTPSNSAALDLKYGKVKAIEIELSKRVKK